MPIDFIKKPAGGGPPIVNVNGNKPADFMDSLTRFSTLVKADEFRVHPVRRDVASPTKVKLSFSVSVPFDEIHVLKSNEIVIKVFGLPYSAEQLKDLERFERFKK